MADNLEELNKQLEDAQSRLTEAENKYSDSRERLSKIGEEYYKTTMLTIDEQKHAVEAYKRLRKTLDKEDERRRVLTNALDEATKIEKQKVNKAKEEVSELEKRIQEAKKPGFWARHGWTKDKDLLTSQYTSYQVSSGLSALFEGRILSGTTQLLKVIPQVANFMGGPLYGAMVAVAGATNKAVEAMSSFSVNAKRLSGGLDVSKTKFKQQADLYASAIMYNQNSEDYTKFAMSDIGTGMRQRLFEDGVFKNTYFSTRASLEQIGADPNKANSLILQQLQLGRSSTDIRRFNYELKEVTKTMNLLGSDKFLSAYEELNRTLIANNINGMANAKTLAQFQDALSRGTLSVSDFTRSLTSRRSSDTSTLAGVGALMAEKGLGGKELQEAYRSGDMIRVAGIMRRGGNQISRGIEKLETGYAQELAQSLGTTDIRELLALQSSTSWGGLGPDLKKLSVQNTLASGGSMVIGTTSEMKPVTEKELEQINLAEKELIDESIKLKGNFQAVGEAAKYAALALSSLYEGRNSNSSTNTYTTINNNTVTNNPYGGNVKIVNQSQLSGE